jgi:tetratricopeptide (TPR) repeat protein
MRLRAILHITGKIAAGILLPVLIAGEISASSLFAFQADSAVSLGKLKSMAEAQHEIVMLLIKKKEFEKAIAEANKIFDMKWPNDQEPLLLEEMLNLTKQLHQQGQALLGVNLIERNLKIFKRKSSQAALLKEQGYLHKSLDQNDKALDCFKKARDIEGSN